MSPEGAAWNLIKTCLKWCHLSQLWLVLRTTSLKMTKICQVSLADLCSLLLICAWDSRLETPVVATSITHLKLQLNFQQSSCIVGKLSCGLFFEKQIFNKKLCSVFLTKMHWIVVIARFYMNIYWLAVVFFPAFVDISEKTWQHRQNANHTSWVHVHPSAH